MVPLPSPENDASCGLILYDLYYAEVCSLYVYFAFFFFFKYVGVAFFQMLFCIYCEDHMIFILHFVNVVYHIA